MNTFQQAYEDILRQAAQTAAHIVELYDAITYMQGREVPHRSRQHAEYRRKTRRRNRRRSR